MPSVHVGWAILVAIAVIGTARTRWRWLILLYPALTTLVVVVTANHYWADGIVAAALLGPGPAGPGGRPPPCGQAPPPPAPGQLPCQFGSTSGTPDMG